MQGIGLGYATSNRGACHLRGYTPASEVMGVPGKSDPLAWEGKGKLLKAFQDLHAISDSFDICKFSAFAENIDDYLTEYKAMTGVDIDADGLLRTGERIYNLERYYNNLCGFTGKDDTLQKNSYDPRLGPAANHVSELDKMKEEYSKTRVGLTASCRRKRLRELEIVA